MDSDSTRLSHAVGLEVYETDDGLIVFDPATDRVHHLNPSAAVVFELCNGSAERAELPGLVAQLYSLDEPPRDTVEAVLQDLVGQGVLIEVRGDVAE